MNTQQNQKMNEINKALDQLQEDKADTEALKQAKANDDGYRVSCQSMTCRGSSTCQLARLNT